MGAMIWSVLVLLQLILSLCQANSDAVWRPRVRSRAPPTLNLQIDSQSLSPLVVQRLTWLLGQLPYKVVPLACNQNLNSTASADITLSFGNCVLSKQLISSADLQALGSEGFIVRSAALSNVSVLIATNGNPLAPDVFGLGQNNGLIYGCYALLEELGFAFLHPLAPSIPASLTLPKTSLNISESPRWPIRIWHYHSEHPLELTNFLQGWGSETPENRTSFEAMKPEFISYTEWMVANRQNRIEWVIIIAEKWATFGRSQERQRRFAEINAIAQSFGVATGADIPICMIQQHAMYMTDGQGTMTQQQAEIRKALDWIFASNFNFISTEAGSTEFTHPSCTVMLAWMNYVTEYTASKPNRRTYIKVHCSNGQVCPEFIDPRTNKPINFNYLPYFANGSLGILPHTVQLYRFDDPASNTYGNTDFNDMYNFSFFAAPHRETVYFGETAYWVTYDINVPLFLPIYGQARLYDLRKIAFNEEKTNVRLSGQAVFHSGSEWSYWLSDSVTARAAWNPYIDRSLEDAYKTLITPLTRHLGSQGPAVANYLWQACEVQHDLLVLGLLNGTAPNTTKERNGIAYIEGWDTWTDLERMIAYFGSSVITQPTRLDMELLMVDPFVWDFYLHGVVPLLQQLESSMNQISDNFASIQINSVPTYLQPLIRDFQDSALVTALRAQQVANTYYALWPFKGSSWKQQHILAAEIATDNAMVVIRRRESQYRVPVERVGAWKYGPTAYSYGYLWTVHSGYFFYRDVLKARKLNLKTFTPCFMNIISPMDELFGEGLALNFTLELMEIMQKFNQSEIGNCLHAPVKEPIFSWNASTVKR